MGAGPVAPSRNGVVRVRRVEPWHRSRARAVLILVILVVVVSPFVEILWLVYSSHRNSIRLGAFYDGVNIGESIGAVQARATVLGFSISGSMFGQEGALIVSSDGGRCRISEGNGQVARKRIGSLSD